MEWAIHTLPARLTMWLGMRPGVRPRVRPRARIDAWLQAAHEEGQVGHPHHLDLEGLAKEGRGLGVRVQFENPGLLLEEPHGADLPVRDDLNRSCVGLQFQVRGMQADPARMAQAHGDEALLLHAARGLGQQVLRIGIHGRFQEGLEARGGLLQHQMVAQPARTILPHPDEAEAVDLGLPVALAHAVRLLPQQPLVFVDDLETDFLDIRKAECALFQPFVGPPGGPVQGIRTQVCGDGLEIRPAAPANQAVGQAALGDGLTLSQRSKGPPYWSETRRRRREEH